MHIWRKHYWDKLLISSQFNLQMVIYHHLRNGAQGAGQVNQKSKKMQKQPSPIPCCSYHSVQLGQQSVHHMLWQWFSNWGIAKTLLPLPLRGGTVFNAVPELPRWRWGKYASCVTYWGLSGLAWKMGDRIQCASFLPRFIPCCLPSYPELTLACPHRQCTWANRQTGWFWHAHSVASHFCQQLGHDAAMGRKGPPQ